MTRDDAVFLAIALGFMAGLTVALYCEHWWAIAGLWR